MQDEVLGVLCGGTGDAKVHCALDDLKDRPIGGGHVVALVARHQMGFRHLDVVERHRHRHRQRGALAKAGPVVEHAEAFGSPVRDGIERTALVIEGSNRHQMRQRSRTCARSP